MNLCLELTVFLMQQFVIVALLITIHIGFFATPFYLYFYPLMPLELSWHVFAYFAGGFSLTALYHRSWGHGSVIFHPAVERILAICSTLILQGPASSWISDHLKHHRHTDQTEDPHNICKGFWWAHINWIIFTKPTPPKLPSRLANNEMVLWQDRWYGLLFFATNFPAGILVSVMSGNPWWGGIVLTLGRLTIMAHVVFAINSIGHTYGSCRYTTRVSATDAWWFPFALGDQYHNYHHAHPSDYRHGVGKWAFDPTKWLIVILAEFGLAKNLVAGSANQESDLNMSA